MVIVNRYQKLTAELIIKLLREADRLNLDLDKMLSHISEDVLKDVIKELRQLEKDGKIDLNKGIKLENNPAIYMALKDIEKQIQHKFVDYCWIGYQVISEHLMNVYQTTAQSTYEIFNRPDLITQYKEPIQAQPKPPMPQPQVTMPKVQITDSRNLKEKIEIPWCKDGKIYSERLYSNVANFESKLAFVLEEGVTKGKGEEWMIQAWRKLTGASAYEAARLIKTETMAMWSLSTKESYLNMGIEYIEIVGDAACGALCEDYQVGPIPLKEAEISTDLPPFHPNCACSYIAYTEETDDIQEIEDNLE